MSEHSAIHPAWLLVPFALQSLWMAIDELICHEGRGLGSWESKGHPFDTLTVVLAYGFLVAFNPSPTTLAIYIAWSAISCLIVTKDEFVHARECRGLEQWIHAQLFVLHPVTLGAAGYLWWNSFYPTWLVVLFSLTLLTLCYQWVRWNRRSAHTRGSSRDATNSKIDNSIYEELGDRWYTAFDDPVALLRAESEIKVPWISSRLRPLQAKTILDVGCGGGFAANALAREGYQVTGVDLSQSSLEVARKHDSTQTVNYLKADAYKLPFENASFDAVCSLDFLEHVEDPARAIGEIARVLKPGGQFFFHTFNRNPIAYIVVIKLVEWLVANTPRDMHVLRLFIKPSELKKMCERAGLQTLELTGLMPKFSTFTLASVRTGFVPANLEFELTGSTLLSYMGVARKGSSPKRS
jgi:2-polyprenyl-6-hydroxyphenyl methylase/3-demethylubiquinone-9 3-methyltransferase